MSADNSAQLQSPSYRLAMTDTDFLTEREELRGLRFAAEYAKPDLILRDWGVRSTIIVFGSARVPSPELAAEFAAKARSAAEKALAERMARWAPWYEEARAFGRLVSLEGGALRHDGGWRDNVIATGGGPGIMEGANRGAAEVGAPSIGFNITLPAEQEPNAYSTPELTFRFHYFAMRKMHLAMRARALAVFPGGFGTMDELFEILTLQQTHKASPMPVILIGRDYWTRAVNFDYLLESGMIGRQDLKIFDFADSGAEAWSLLKKHGIKPLKDAAGQAARKVP